MLLRQRNLRKFEEAEALIRTALNQRPGEKVLGPKHPSKLIFKENLVDVLARGCVTLKAKACVVKYSTD